MRIGLDFGTTNSVATVVENDAVRVLPLDASDLSRDTLRTLLYVERDGFVRVGQDAVRTYREQNVGRVPVFARKWIGFLDVHVSEFVSSGYVVGGQDEIVDVYADVDAEMPGRLLHSLKTPLASDYKGTSLFGKFYSLEDLIAEFLSRVREQIERSTGQSIEHAVFGRPVNFVGASDGDADALNTRAQMRLAEAARLAGFANVSFVMEPIAAGMAAAHGSTPSDTEHSMVFDFGGGTLDLAVLRHDPNAVPQVLSTGGVGIAGDHFDKLIFKRMLRRWFGEGVKWRVTDGAPMHDLPDHMLDALGDWQDIPQLCNEEVLRFIRHAQSDCTAPIRLMALEDLVARGHAYDVYAEVERAKAALSHARFETITYKANAIDVWQPILRTQFEAMMSREARQISQLIDDTLQRANVSASDITRVVRTGGSSSIPLFVDLLARKFGAERVAERDLFTAVASGLALAAV